MANDKRFIAKNGLQAQNILLVDSASNNAISMNMLTNDVLSFSGNTGQLFSISDNMSGTIFAVNDISGIPSIEVIDDGTIRFAETFGNVLIGTTNNGADKLQVNGNVSISGRISANSIVGPLSGNANTATAWQTPRTITIGSTGKTVNGSANVSWTLTELGVPSNTGIGASGTWGISVTGNAGTATALQTARTISLGGDLSGSASFNGSSDITITATVAANSVALGADTTGNYVATIAGTVNEIEVTGSGTETAAVTIGLPDSVTITNDLIIGRNLTITGNLTVTGNTTIISANNLAIEDNMIYLNEGSVIANPDLGIVGNYNDGTYTHTGIFRDATDNRWKFFKRYDPEPDASIDTAHASFVYGDVQANNFYASTFTGALVGNASTATILQTARTIGDVSFNGSASIVPSRIDYKDTRAVDFAPYTYSGTTLHLKTNGTDGITDGGTYHGILNLQHWSDSSGGKVHQLAFTDNNNIFLRASTNTSVWDSWLKLYDTSDASANTVANSLVLRDSNGSFSANTITAAISGNATTATTLQTARTIWGQSFNGSSNITGDFVTTGKVTANNGIFSGVSAFGSGASLNTLRTVYINETYNPASSISNLYNIVTLDNTSTPAGNTSSYAALNDIVVNTQNPNGSLANMFVYGALNRARGGGTAGNSNNMNTGFLVGSRNEAYTSTTDPIYRYVDKIAATENYGRVFGNTAIVDSVYGTLSYARTEASGVYVGTAIGVSSVAGASIAGGTANVAIAFQGSFSTGGTVNNKYGFIIYDTTAQNFLAGGLKVGGTTPTGISAGGIGVDTPPPGIGKLQTSSDLIVGGLIRLGSTTPSSSDFIIDTNRTTVVPVGGSPTGSIMTTGGNTSGSYHIGFEIPANDINDGFFVTTDSNLDGIPDIVALKIRADGNIGISNTAPTSKLHVTGAATSSGVVYVKDTSAAAYTAPVGIKLQKDGTLASQVSPTLEFEVGTGGGQARLYTTRLAGNGGTLIVETDNTSGTSVERMRIDSSGYVGIGATSPSNKLHLTDTSANTSTVLYPLRIERETNLIPTNGIGVGIQFSTETDNASAYRVGSTIESVATDVTLNNEDFDLVFKNMTAGAAASEKMRVTSDGKILIGTTETSAAHAIVAASGAALFRGFTSEIASNLTMSRAGGTRTAPTQASGAALIGRIQFDAYTGNTYGTTSWIEGRTEASPIDTSTPGYLTFNTTPAGTTGAGTGAIERMRISSNGNIGIGTSTIPATLTIGGVAGGDRSFQIGSAGATRAIMTTDGTNGIVSLGATNDSTTGILTFKTGSALSERMRISANGNIGVGTTLPSYALHVTGTVAATDFDTLSDRNLKENIVNIDNALKKVNQINGVYFNFKNDPSRRHAGVIAQEIEAVLPEVISRSNDGILSVGYGNIVGLLIEAIKEQQKQIDELKSIILNK